jgi:hypothetical protein
MAMGLGESTRPGRGGRKREASAKRQPDLLIPIPLSPDTTGSPVSRELDLDVDSWSVTICIRAGPYRLLRAVAVTHEQEWASCLFDELTGHSAHPTVGSALATVAADNQHVEATVVGIARQQRGRMIASEYVDGALGRDSDSPSELVLGCHSKRGRLRLEGGPAVLFGLAVTGRNDDGDADVPADARGQCHCGSQGFAGVLGTVEADQNAPEHPLPFHLCVPFLLQRGDKGEEDEECHEHVADVGAESTGLQPGRTSCQPEP